VVQCCCKVATFPIARYAAKVVHRCCKLVVRLRVQIDRSSAVWNNDGDEGTVRDASGNVVDSCAYVGGGVEVGCE
jgi:hypothetical protein